MSNLKTCQDPPNQGQGIWPYFQKNQKNYFVENKMIKHIFFYLSNFKILHFFDEIFMADHTLFEFFVHRFAFGEFLLQVNNLIFQTLIHSDPKLGIPFEIFFCGKKPKIFSVVCRCQQYVWLIF
jgi:hypothetical protein